MNVAAAVVVMLDRAVPGAVGDVERRSVIGRRRLRLVMVVFVAMIGLVVVVDHGRLRIGHGRELQAVFDAMLGVDHAMRLQRDHDGHAETDAEVAEQLRQ